MKPSAPADTQPENHRLTILDDEEREAVVQPFINSLNAEATECFADFLITLINETHRQLFGANRLEGELLAALDLTFRHSKAYELALDLYSSRFSFVPGTVSVTGLNLEDMLIDIKRSRVTERQEAMPEEWAMEFGGTVGRLLNNNKLSEVSYISLSDPLIELVSESDHSLGNLGIDLLPFVLTKFFARMTTPKIILLITAADARNPKEPLEMGRLTQGRVWEDFEKLVIDLDKLLPPLDEEMYHPLTIALEREDGARYIVYHREVANSLVEKLFDYAEEHLEVDSTIRPAIGLQANNAPTRESNAQAAAFNAGDKDTDAQASEAGALAGQIKPEPIAEIGKSLLHLAKTQTSSSNWIEELGPMIAEALESDQLPDDTRTALEDFVTNITDEHASGYADQARHLLALGLRRIIANPPEDTEDDDDADAEDSEDAEAVPRPAPHNMIFNLCDYQYLRLDFLLSEGGDKVFSFSLQRDSATSKSGKGNADACFYTFGERDASYMYEGLFLRKHEGAIEHTVSIVISGEGKVQFCGYKDVLLFSLYWEKEGDSLDGGFDVFDNTGLAQSLEFSMEA